MFEFGVSFSFLFADVLEAEMRVHEFIPGGLVGCLGRIEESTQPTLQAVRQLARMFQVIVSDARRVLTVIAQARVQLEAKLFVRVSVTAYPVVAAFRLADYDTTRAFRPA